MIDVRIGFSTPKRFNPVSWLVRTVMGSKCSHTWFCFEHPIFRFYVVLEAHELGFREVPLTTFQRKNNVVAVFRSPVDLYAGIQWAGTWLATAYDFAGLLGMSWVMVGRRFFHKKWRNPLENTHAMFCSEMAVSVLRRCDYPGSQELYPAETTPQDLLDFMEASRADRIDRSA